MVREDSLDLGLILARDFKAAGDTAVKWHYLIMAGDFEAAGNAAAK